MGLNMWGKPSKETDSAQDKRIAAGVKGMVYKMLWRPAMMSKTEAELEVAELRMLRLLLWVTTMDKIRNEYISDMAQIEPFGGKVKLSWFGHVQSGYTGQRMLNMEVSGRTKRKEDSQMQWRRICRDLWDRVRWMQMQCLFVRLSSIKNRSCLMGVRVCREKQVSP